MSAIGGKADIALGSPATWLLTQVDLGSLPSVTVCKPIQYCYISVENRNSFKPTLRETMENTVPGIHAPMAVNVTVGRSLRPREYLTEREIEKLIKAAGENRWGHRDATATSLSYALSSRTLKARIGRLKPFSSSSPTGSVPTIGSAATCTRPSTRICPSSARAHSRAARFTTWPFAE